MLFFEAFFKFTNLGVALVLVVLVLKAKQDSLQSRLILLICLAFICTLLTTGHESLSISGPAALPMRIFDTISAACIWLLGLSMFNDNFKIRRGHWIIVISYVLLMVISRFYFLGFVFASVIGDWVTTIAAIFSLILMTHLGWTALKGRNEDLVETRRKARVTLSVALVLLISSIIFIEQFAILNDWERKFDLSLYVLYVFSLPISIGCAFWLAHYEPDSLKFHKASANQKDVATLDPREQLAFNKLVKVIETQRGFAEHGLTIGKLAEKLGMPAHQLRPLINNTLGYSNFSEFLNHYRIEEVKRGLSDLELARTPILTLALDAGFSTLSTFNRAFKMETGITPTDFRSNALKNRPEE